MKQKLLICLSAFIFSLNLQTAKAASSGWINAVELQTFHKNVLLKGNVPTRIKCKNQNNVVGMNRKNTLVNITYKKVTRKIHWRWAWGDHVGITNHKFRKKGF